MCFNREVGIYVIFLKLLKLKSGWIFYKVGTSGTFKLANSGILKPYLWKVFSWGLPGGSDSKEFACNIEEPGSIPGWERSPGEGHGNPLQYSCLENPVDRGAWWATVYLVAKSRIQLTHSIHIHM